MPYDTIVIVVSWGEYLTPYQATLFYHDRSALEVTIALLSRTTQLIQITPDLNGDSIMSICKYVSPDLIIFGDDFSRDEILEFIRRGFQFVRIFAHTDTARNKYLDSGEIFDERVRLFDIDTIYENVYFTDEISTIYLVEHIISAFYPAHNNKFNDKEINYTTGNHLLRYLTSGKADYAKKLLDLQSGMNSFDKISTAITYGKASYEICENMCLERLANGISYTINDLGVTIYTIDSIGLVTTDLCKIAQSYPKFTANNMDCVLLYMIDPHCIEDVTYIGWRIILLPISDKLSADKYTDFLKQYALGDVQSIPTGGFICWVPGAEIDKLLPFLCKESYAKK